MSFLTTLSLVIYSSWRAMNVYESYRYNEKMTLGNIWEIFYSLIMIIWLIKASYLFLVVKIFDGLFSLGVGLYISILDGPDSFLEKRNKVVNGYWGYTVTDILLCTSCYFMSFLGVING